MTGPQSIARIVPLLSRLSSDPSYSNVVWKEENDSRNVSEVTFVWETACEIEWRPFHNRAIVLNKLNNSQVRYDFCLRIIPINGD